MTKIEDIELRRKPIAELDWWPSVDASQIGLQRRMRRPRSKSC
jgi:hypothetical protein